MNKPKRTVSWFRHYCRHGDSLKIVESLHGPRGYTCWFKLLERLGASDDHKLDMDTDSKKLLLLWSEAGLNHDEGREVMALFAELEMIDKELHGQGVLWCQHLVDGVAELYAKRTGETPARPESVPEEVKSGGGIAKSGGRKTGSRIEEVERKKKEYISPRLGEHENVKLTQAELDKLIERFTKERTLDLITRLSDYLASKGDKYKSHYATMLSWARRDGSGATKPQAPTMTAEQEGKRKMLKNELSALHDKLEAKKQVPEGHPIYAEAKREIKWINKRIDAIEKELEG